MVYITIVKNVHRNKVKVSDRKRKDNNSGISQNDLDTFFSGSLD